MSVLHGGVLCRYEEQSSKLSQLETAHRSLKVQLLRSGGTPASVAFASVRTPSAKTPTLGQVSATPPAQTGTSSQPNGCDVRRELDFTNSEAAAANVACDDLASLGQENSGGFGSVSPALAFAGVTRLPALAAVQLKGKHAWTAVHLCRH